MKSIYSLIFLILISLILYTFTFRGDWSNPSVNDIDLQHHRVGTAFETSQEGSRFAMIFSLINDKTLEIDKYAYMGTPDVGKINGHFYSLFPPAISIMAIPLYLLGFQLGASQIFTFSLSTIFAICTMILIWKFAIKLGLRWQAATFASLAFGFATNAWGYSVTLYAHLVSAFLVLSATYLTVYWQGKFSSLKIVLVWIIYSIASFVDYPNLFIFLPIVIYLTMNGISATSTGNKTSINIRPIFFIAPFIFIAFLVGYGYYNYHFFGSPLKLSNAIPRVTDINLPEETSNAAGGAESATSALKTRYLLQGLNSFIVSIDRGALVFSPIILLFVFGLGFLKNKLKNTETILISVPAVCLLLYSMFGDPYGGWAFGSRYLIAIAPELCLLAGIGLHRYWNKILIKLLYSIVFIYSSGISLLAPLTTNVIPPYVEARNFGIDYTYIINWRMLNDNNLNSYFYNNILHGSVSGLTYYSAILLFVSLIGLALIWMPKPKSQS